MSENLTINPHLCLEREQICFRAYALTDTLVNSPLRYLQVEDKTAGRHWQVNPGQTASVREMQTKMRRVNKAVTGGSCRSRNILCTTTLGPVWFQSSTTRQPEGWRCRKRGRWNRCQSCNHLFENFCSENVFLALSPCSSWSSRASLKIGQTGMVCLQHRSSGVFDCMRSAGGVVASCPHSSPAEWMYTAQGKGGYGRRSVHHSITAALHTFSPINPIFYLRRRCSWYTVYNENRVRSLCVFGSLIILVY